MTRRDMQTNCAKKRTAPRSSKPRSFRKKSDFQQWRGMQADGYAKWYCADTFLRECPRSLQVIDLKGKNELRNCAPLKGEEKAAQNGFSLPSVPEARPWHCGSWRVVFRTRAVLSALTESFPAPRGCCLLQLCCT